MSNSREDFIEAFVYSMYGKCQIQMVYYICFAVFRVQCAPKEENHSLSRIKNSLATIHTSAASEKENLTEFGGIYIEEC